MKRFTLVAGMGEAEMVVQPEGEWVSATSVEALLVRLEGAAKIWRDEAEVSGHVSNYLLGLVEFARNTEDK